MSFACFHQGERSPCASGDTRSTPKMSSSSSSTTLYASEEDLVSDPGYIARVNTSLNTSLLLMVRGHETISEVKEEVMRLHSSNFPRFGEIKIDDIKFKCQSCLHSLEESMPVCMILNERKDALQLFVDASSSVEHHGELLHEWSDSESDDLQTYPDSPVAIIRCSICLQGFDAGKISGTQQVGNSVPSFESHTKPNEENFPTGMACEGTLQSYSSDKNASSSRKTLRSDENSSHRS